MTVLSRRSVLAGSAAAAAMVGASARLAPGHAAAPPAGKQAPGWYRFKVGEFEVTIVTDGANVAPAIPDGYVVNASKADINGALAAEFRPADRVTGTYTPTVVNTGSKLVAIDTGLGLGMYQQSKGAVGQYHTNLEAAGIDRNAVDVVIISHFHGDHINGLVGPENKPAFPNAEVMVPAAEMAFWSDESNASKLIPPARQFANIKRVFGVVGKVTQYEAGKELVPGITAVATPGHTPGHTSHLVTSGSGKLLVQADVTAGAASLFVRNPNWQFMFDTDRAQAVETRKKVYDMAAVEKLLVQGYHFGFPSLAYVEKAGDGYRLIPAPWNPVI